MKLTPTDIKKIRADSGDMSQQEFADALHVSRQLVVAWEAGTSAPTTYHLIVLLMIWTELNDDDRAEMIIQAMRSGDLLLLLRALFSNQDSE